MSGDNINNKCIFSFFSFLLIICLSIPIITIILTDVFVQEKKIDKHLLGFVSFAFILEIMVLIGFWIFVYNNKYISGNYKLGPFEITTKTSWIILSLILFLLSNIIVFSGFTNNYYKYNKDNEELNDVNKRMSSKAIVFQVLFLTFKSMYVCLIWIICLYFYLDIFF